MSSSALDAVLAAHELRLEPSQLERLERYSALLREWNERVNLTAIIDPAQIRVKHFLDSLTLLRARPPASGARLIDVGTGAGFPGVPLAIARRDLQVTLVESVAKKVRFLETLVEQLRLANVTIAHARAEDLAHEAARRERYDVAVVRALPTLATNLELLLPFCRTGGYAAAYKGRIEAERAAAERAAGILGAKITSVVTSAELGMAAELPGRCLVIATKLAATPSRYPRPAVEMKRHAW